MKLLTYLVAIIGFLHHVEAKAFQAGKNNIKGTFDHMNENLYLKKIPHNGGQGYEMRYVPHVDGKPIFIPVDEAFLPPNILKARPTKKYPIPKSDKNKLNVHFEPSMKPLTKQKDTKMHLIQGLTTEYLKAKKESENQQIQKDFDHPLVIDVVTETVFDSHSFKDEHEPVIIRPIKKKPVVKEAIKIKPSELDKKQEAYKTGDYTKKKIQTNSSLKLDPDKVLQHKVKEKIPIPYEKEDGSLMQPFDDQDYDSPIVIESLRKEYDYPLSEKQAGSTVHKKEVTKKKPDNSLKYHKEKLDTKISEKKPIPNKALKHQYEIKSETKSKDSEESFDLFSPDGENSEQDYNQDYEDYDSPVIVEALVKKNPILDQRTEMMYDSPVVVEALVKKNPIDKKTETLYDSPVVVGALVKKTDQKEQNAHPIQYKEASNGEYISDDSYATPVVIEALVVKNQPKLNKKRVKYSTKMKHPESSISKLKDTPQNKPNPDEQSKPTLPNSFVKQSIVEHFSNEDLFSTDNLRDENDQFDSGSGIINERSSDSSRLSHSNVWPLLTSFHSQERNKFKKCTTSNKEPGNCMPIQMCPTPNFQLTLDDLLKKICAIDEVFIGICCPEFPAETLKVDWENFNNVSSNDQEESKPEECGKINEESHSWPWMAPLISMSTRKIFCGGVLIKPQYVLTAAHCTRKIPRNQIVVVFGPLEKDGTNQEFEVVEIKRHSLYNPKTMQFDIALLKLARKVARPSICLPREENFVGMKAIMLGWRGSFTASKIEEKLLILSSQECPKTTRDILCTETRTEDVMCNVDSGAPLILKQDEKYEVIGLLTWNRNDCNFPALFTRVSHFTGWIENHSSS